MLEHDARAAPQQQRCRSQRGRAPVASKMQPASDVEAAAGSVQREDDDAIAQGGVGLLSATQPCRLGSASHGPEAARREYSRGLLLAHRALSLRIARGAPGLEQDPAFVGLGGAGLQA